MTHNGDALSRFRGILLQDVTIEQLDAVLGPTSLTPATAEQLEQAALIAQAVSAQRTYCPGSALPIPELGQVEGILVEALGTGLIQPSGTEIWDIKHIWAQGAGGTATITFSFTDGTADSDIQVGATVDTAGRKLDLNESTSSPVYLTNSLYLKVEETAGSYGVALFIARQVVGR